MQKSIIFRWWKQAFLPLSFIFSSLLNFAFYYLGLAFLENPARSYGFILGNMVFAVSSGITLLFVLRRYRLTKLSWGLLSAVMAFYVVCYGAGLLSTSSRSVIMGYIPKFIIFCLPAFFAGICGALWQAEKSFFYVLEQLCFFVFPAALIYVNGALFNCNPFGYGAYLGIIGYMPFAYTILPFLLTLMFRFSDKEDLILPILKRKSGHPQLIRGVFIVVFWLAIIASGTRGAYVGALVFFFLLVFSKLIHREPWKQPMILSLCLLCIFLFNLYIYAPPGFQGVHRMDVFLDGLKEGQLVTDTSEVTDIDDKLGDLVNADGNQQVTNRPNEGDSEAETPSQEPGEEDIAAENLQIGNRGTLFKLAIGEFMKDPLTGMGPGGYEVKYGNNPHNVILEILCETGIFGTIVWLGLIVLAIVLLIRKGWTNKPVRYLLLFFLIYAVRANIGGYVWTCSYILCALGYGLTIPQGNKQPLVSPPPQ